MGLLQACAGLWHVALVPGTACHSRSNIKNLWLQGGAGSGGGTLVASRQQGGSCFCALACVPHMLSLRPCPTAPSSVRVQYSAAKLTDDDKSEIRALSRDPRIGERLCCSLCLCCWLPRCCSPPLQCCRRRAGTGACSSTVPTAFMLAHHRTPTPTSSARRPAPPPVARRRAHREVHRSLHLRPPEHQAGHCAGHVWRAGEAPLGHAPPAWRHQHAAAGRPWYRQVAGGVGDQTQTQSLEVGLGPRSRSRRGESGGATPNRSLV